MKMNKLLSLVLTLAMTLSLAVTASAADTAAATVAKGDIVVLYTNDAHCAVDKGLGYAGLAAYKAEMKKTTDYVTLVDAGDAIQGEALGTLSKGEYLVEIMNAVGYDMAIPGNHEFDYGMDRFLELAKLAKSGYYCCNFVDLRTGKTVFDAYKMVTYGNTKVAYVAIDTPEAISKSTPTYFQNDKGEYIYGFCAGNDGKDLYKAVQTAIDDAKTAGADYVIAVGHCGVDSQSAPWRSTDIIANVTGLSAFIDGHSHSTIAGDKVIGKDGKAVLLTSTGTKLAAIGKLVLKTNGTVSTELVTDYAGKDEAVAAVVKDIQAKNDALLKTVVAKTSVELTINGADGKRAIRNQETNLGDLCADAYRTVGGADVAIVNGGGIRATIAKGDVTYEQIIAVHPYGNALCVVEATGQEILDALEMAARSTPGENGGFLQVSGLSYTIDTTIPSSVKVDDNKMFVSVDGPYRVKDVTIDGKSIVVGDVVITAGSAPLDLKKTYTLASHDYMLKSAGDGINMFQDNKILKDSVMLDNQVLISYITETLKGTVSADYARAQGRITVIREPFADVADSAWYYSGVVYAYENSLFKGKSDTTFAPYQTMTRGQLATVLYRMAGSPEPKALAAFTDLPAAMEQAKAISWAVENGVTKGWTDTTFEPNRAITRQQMAYFLWQYAKLQKMDVSVGEDTNILSYTDVASVSEYAIPAMQWATGAGVMEGSDGALNPTGTAYRCHVAVLLMRFCENVK